MTPEQAETKRFETLALDQVRGVANAPRRLLDFASEQKAKFETEIKQAAKAKATEIMTTAGVPGPTASAISDVVMGVVEGREIDPDALAKGIVVAVAFAACSACTVCGGPAFGLVCGAIAGALYQPVKDAFVNLFGGCDSRCQADRRRAAEVARLKSEAEQFYNATQGIIKQRDHALITFLRQGLRLYGARVVGVGASARLWYADPESIRQDPFRTPIRGKTYSDQKLAALQVAYLNGFLKIVARKVPWLRPGDLKPVFFETQTGYDFTLVAQYIKPAYRAFLVGGFPEWLRRLSVSELDALHQQMYAAYQADKRNVDGWKLCIPYYPGLPNLTPPANMRFFPGAANKPEHVEGDCRSPAWVCSVNSSTVHCTLPGYGAALHPPGNVTSFLNVWKSFPTATGGTVNRPASVDFRTSPENAVERNRTALAFHVQQLQILTLEGSYILREMADIQAQALGAARLTGAEQEIARLSEELTASEARERAASDRGSSSWVLLALLAAGAGGLYWWSTTSSSKPRRPRSG